MNYAILLHLINSFRTQPTHSYSARYHKICFTNGCACTVYTNIHCHNVVVYENRCFGRHNEWHFVHRRQIDSFQDCAPRRARYVDSRSSRRSHERRWDFGVFEGVIVTVSRSSVGRGGGDRDVSANRVQAHVQRHIPGHRQHVFRGVLRRRFNNAHPVRVFILVKTATVFMYIQWTTAITN